MLRYNYFSCTVHVKCISCKRETFWIKRGTGLDASINWNIVEKSYAANLNLSTVEGSRGEKEPVVLRQILINLLFRDRPTRGAPVCQRDQNYYIKHKLMIHKKVGYDYKCNYASTVLNV